MSFFDWCIVLIPTAFVMYMGLYSRKYIAQVSDFLSAGRICGRYVISVADIANAIAILGLTSYVEIHYKTGFSMMFWTTLYLPLGIILSLTGFCTYRFRETKAMSFGQFLEMRYSRPLRIFAAALRSFSEMLANMIMPAVAARFFIYFLDLPRTLNFCGLSISTFGVVMLICLTLAISLICYGGTLTLVITDAIQGMICYPLMAIFTFYVLYKFSWNNEVVPVMMDRIQGESFLNPLDVANLRDFGPFYITFVLFSTIINRANWIGAGNSSAARSPHEQKMAALLGTWRNAMANVFYIVIAVMLIALLNHKHFAPEAKGIRDKISVQVAKDIMTDAKMRDSVIARLQKLPPQIHNIGTDAPLSEKKNLDTVYFNEAKLAIMENCPDDPALGNDMAQRYKTLYLQMMMAVGMRNILPPGLIGAFCLLMVLAMISTDDTRIYSAALTLAQDVVLPFFKTPPSPKTHIWIIRIVSIGIGVFFFCGSFFMSQLDYLSLFSATMTSMWAGAGAMMLFGLYSSFGTTAGAWTSLLTGMTTGAAYIITKQYWAWVYQFIVDQGWAETANAILVTCSKPFNPWISWHLDPQKMPINSYEFAFMNMILTFILYIIVSKLTCKQPFNLERMLHRGKYNLDGDNKTRSKWSWKTVFGKLIGITPEYTTGDKVIAWALFGYSIVFRFCISFIGVLLFNFLVFRWSEKIWGHYFLIVSMVIPGIIAVISTVWFGIGGVVDLRRLFRDLKNRVINELDNGAVEGNMSLADKKELEAIDAADKK